MFFFLNSQILGAGGRARQVGPAGVGGPAAGEARADHLHVRGHQRGSHRRCVQNGI